MSFQDELRAAMDTLDPVSYIDRVKKVVHDQLQRIDSTAHIQDTRYFNHSAIPDFVLTWSGQKLGRHVYLRDSYESMAAGHDGRYLTEGDPFLMSLEEASAENAPALDAVESESGDRILLTDIDAVAVVADADRAGSSPLARVVRANFIRGARGRVDKPVAEVLVEAGNAESADAPSDSGIAETIARNFFDDAAFQIARTASILSAASQPEAANSGEGYLSGRLSVTELRTLLPWLLQQERTVTNDDFWPQIARMTDLADMEKAQESLQGLNLNPMVDAAADLWEARWAYVGLSTPIEGDDTYELRRNYWSFLRGSLGIDMGGSRVSVAANGKSIPKTRGGRSTPTWQAARSTLEGERIASVELHGLRRSVSISAQQSPDVRADIEEVTSSLSDSYFLNHLTVRVPSIEGYEGDAEIHVDFGSGLLKAPAGASLRQVHRVSVQVLGLDQQPGHASPAGAEQASVVAQETSEAES